MSRAIDRPSPDLLVARLRLFAAREGLLEASGLLVGQAGAVVRHHNCTRPVPARPTGARAISRSIVDQVAQRTAQQQRPRDHHSICSRSTVILAAFAIIGRHPRLTHAAPPVRALRSPPPTARALLCRSASPSFPQSMRSSFAQHVVIDLFDLHPQAGERVRRSPDRQASDPCPTTLSRSGRDRR